MEGPVRRRVHRAIAAALVVLALASTAAACGGGDDDKSVSSRGDQQGKPSARSWVGLTKKEAIAEAEAEDRAWRILREDDESFLATQDYVPSRINFEIDNGKVTKATYG
jgi:hypothetical protein